MDLNIKKCKEIRDILFFLIVFSVIFDYAPKFLWFNFFGLGGPYSSMLGIYPIMAGFVLLAFMIYKGYIHPWNKYVAIFFGISFFVYELSTVYGLYIYPYWNLILHAAEPQIEKLPWVLTFLHKHNINISYEQLFSVWIFVRSIKATFLDLVYQFGISYMIYLWYQNDFKRGWSIFTKGVLTGLAVFIVYGWIDVFYLHGSSTAAFILMQINPVLHDIGKIHNWWPPLLWKGQFRSVFSEPSRVGNYIAFMLPFLFIPVINKLNHWKYYLVLIFCVSYMVFLTQARTAVSMFIGIMGLTLVLVLFLCGKRDLKQLGMILCTAGIAFIISIATVMAFPATEINPHKGGMNKAVVAYMESNVGSLASSNKRSNQARYALIKSNFKIGLEHPLLGVSPMLNGAYVVDHFDAFDLQSYEVRQWIAAYQKMGPLKHNFDAMNEYITVFATTGILGLSCLLFPFAYGCIGLFLRIRKCADLSIKNKLCCLLIATISSLVAGCNGSLILLYGIWILLPLVYLAITDKELWNEKPL